MILFSEGDASSIRFSRQTDFEIVLLFLTHLRLHDVNSLLFFKNYAFLVTYYLKIHLMLALSHYVVILRCFFILCYIYIYF